MPFWFPLCYHQPTIWSVVVLKDEVYMSPVLCMLGFSSWGTFGWWLYTGEDSDPSRSVDIVGTSETSTQALRKELIPPYVLWNSAHRVTQQWLTLKVELSGRMTSSTNSIGLFLAWWPLVSRGSNSGTLSQGGGGRISVKPSILNFNLKGGKCQLRKRVDVSIFSEEASVIGGGSWILYTGETSV